MSRNNPLLLVPALAVALALPAVAAPAPSGTIKAAGTLTIQGDCRILTDSNGHKFALLGKLNALANGDQIQVSGKEAKHTKCLDGPTIQVAKVEKLTVKAAAKEEPQPSGTPQLDIVTDTGGKASPGAGAKGGMQVRMYHMTGSLIADGKKCQAFRNLKGQVFTLVGDLKGFKTGDKVTLEGVSAEGSPCQQAPTVQVNSIERAQ
ncbi:MAG TPA: hypothetical protein VHQ90_11190 [Thermoanaerobaculia bacterium]|nr:hypothetical protein [Thermoanaerobaculia bacterium]